MEVLVRTEAGFAAFVRENTPALLRTAYLLTSDPVAAEELVQDTLVRLYPKWELVEAAERPLAYVRRTLTNTYINYTRRAARREYATADVPEGIAHDSGIERLPDRDQLWAGLQTLTERQRAALVLRFFHDLDDVETAAALGCRPGTVRSLISRGLATLRERLAAEELS